MSEYNKPVKPTDVVQFSEGPKKGLFAQVIMLEGELKFMCRDWDGSQRVFVCDPEEPFFIVGTAALGPGTGVTPSSVLQPAVPPPLNPEELLQPLPAEVKVQPMNRPIDQPQKPKEKKPKPAPFTGLLRPFIFKVTNGAGDVAEVPLKVRADKKTSQYKGAAIIQATKVIPATKPYTVECVPIIP
jgi:hypothetical protein